MDSEKKIVVLWLLIFAIPTVCAAEIDCVFPSNSALVDFKAKYEEKIFIDQYDRIDHRNGSICSIFVGDNGWFVLVTECSESTYFVDVYDSFCQLQYVLELKHSGEIFAALDATDNMLIIYPLREDVLIKVTPQGQYVCSYPCVQNEQLRSSVSDLGNTSAYESIHNGDRYVCRDGHQFTVSDPQGHEIFHYEVNKQDGAAPAWLLFTVPVILVVGYAGKKAK